jgi:DNA invertase Pin-like site-specific DNA recombinase
MIDLPKDDIGILAVPCHIVIDLLAWKCIGMAIIGYARTSTRHQEVGLEAQKAALAKEGCEKIFAEQVGSIGERAQFERAIEYVREGDVLVVTKLDRLARSVAHLCQVSAELERKGVALKILDMGVNTACPAGRLFLNIVGSIAQFEREIMLERQRDGIAAAQAAGRYKGRKPTARAQEAEIRRLAAEGMKREDIAHRLGLGLRSVYRMLAA